MLDDQYGNRLSTGSAEARDAYAAGLDRFLAALPGADADLDRAVAADPGLAHGHLARARLAQMTGRAAVLRESLDALAALDRRSLTEGERGAIDALLPVLAGKGAAAIPGIRAHLANHPRDALVAQSCMSVFGLIGFSGQPGREAEQLAYTSWLAPHYGDDWWFLSMHAFAQMECGQLAPAAETIARSVAQRPDSANGAHVKAHLHYETGETAAGLAYLDAWRADYDRSGQLHCHVSWHVALWALETGDAGRMWAVLDADIRPAAAWGPAINVLTDTAALLARAEMAGVAVPRERWAEVSAYAQEKFPRPGIAFADAHAALAHAMAGDGAALARIVAEASGPAGAMVRALAEGFGALAAGRWAEAAAHLAEAMVDHARIGGSRAQRDLIEHAMVAALLRDGRAGEARRLLAMRRPVTLQRCLVAGLEA
ncbi:tetratricopeptide repeat protein [Paralimibaculum aggregatum]|uniref:Tetratricopeptide repeat protein 38 n=1 Tax=Paralimibaculum aggregatum TaxID=3036245 RepID=A0ABQ6LK11_9RHOB|nr:tetratricopeptide repeat protein [Limibaculum sp. NKW23]GMG83595.1 tetratricopeptide repeat protein [Limibaculum sp. NKW23]